MCVSVLFVHFRCRERDFLKKVHECLEREGKVFNKLYMEL